jgi:hypothetical protein
MSLAVSFLRHEHDEESAPDDGLVPSSSLLRRVLLLAERRGAWLGSPARKARQGSISSALDDREAERRFYDESPAVQAIERALAERSSSPRNDFERRLERLVNTFGLTPAERDTLELCVAVVLEPRLANLFARMSEDAEASLVSEALVSQLTRRPLPLLSPAGALLGWRLVRRGEADAGTPAPLELDEYVLEFLCGADDDAALRPFASPVLEVAALPSWPVLPAVERARRALELGTPLHLVIRGPRGSGRATFAASLVRALGRTPLAIETSGIRDETWPDVFLRAERQARLTGAAVIWRGANVGRTAPPCPDAPAIRLTLGDADLVLSPERGVSTESIDMPRLGVAERAALFARLIPEAGTWSSAELEELATRHRLHVGDIAAIARRGLGRLDEVREACRAATRHRLGELAQQLECSFKREDLTLAPKLDALLDDLLFEARERGRLWEAPGPRRLFPRGRGLVALMAGPPGTGKTMAAQVIAAELGLDLFRVDLASIVNKYIGETAKNLRRVFAAAADTSAVLLFDEADALFSKRTEVRDSHDRYANADTNYLLQQLEEFDGIALLASNRFGNIDAAFTRRIRYVLDFRAPEAGERLTLWRRTLGELAGAEVADSVASQLRAAAELVELSGAQIKLASLGALLVSRRLSEPLSGAHLCVALQRELGKQGRALGERERAGIERHDR